MRAGIASIKRDVRGIHEMLESQTDERDFFAKLTEKITTDAWKIPLGLLIAIPALFSGLIPLLLGALGPDTAPGRVLEFHALLRTFFIVYLIFPILLVA